MKKSFKIVNPIFKSETLFCLGFTLKEFKKEMKKYNYDYDISSPDIAGTTFSIRQKGFRYRVVWFEDSKDIAGIVHEVVHLCVRICEDKGVPIKAHIETGECGDETFAYMVEFYLNEVIKKIK